MKSIVALITWMAGASFLVPVSAAGIQMAFALPPLLAWAGAIALTGSASAGILHKKWPGYILAVAGVTMNVASDTVNLWASLERGNPLAQHEAAVVEAEEIEMKRISELESLKDQRSSTLGRLNEIEQEMDWEVRENGGKGPNWRELDRQRPALMAMLVKHDEQISGAEMAIQDARQNLARSNVELAKAKESTHPLSRQAWAPVALLGFVAIFEVCLVLLAHIAGSALPRKRRVEAKPEPMLGQGLSALIQTPRGYRKLRRRIDDPLPVPTRLTLGGRYSRN